MEKITLKMKRISKIFHVVLFAKSQNTEEYAERLSILCRSMGEQLDLSLSQMDE